MTNSDNYKVLNHELATKLQQCKIELAHKNVEINQIQSQLFDHKVTIRCLQSSVMNVVQDIGAQLQHLIQVKHFQCSSFFCNNLDNNNNDEQPEKVTPSTDRRRSLVLNSSNGGGGKTNLGTAMDNLQNNLSAILELSDSFTRRLSLNSKTRIFVLVSLNLLKVTFVSVSLNHLVEAENNQQANDNESSSSSETHSSDNAVSDNNANDDNENDTDNDSDNEDGNNNSTNNEQNDESETDASNTSTRTTLSPISECLDSDKESFFSEIDTKATTSSIISRRKTIILQNVSEKKSHLSPPALSFLQKSPTKNQLQNNSKRQQKSDKGISSRTVKKLEIDLKKKKSKATTNKNITSNNSNASTVSCRPRRQAAPPPNSLREPLLNTKLRNCL